MLISEEFSHKHEAPSRSLYSIHSVCLRTIFGGQAEIPGVCSVKRNETENYDVVVWTPGFRLTAKVHSVSA